MQHKGQLTLPLTINKGDKVKVKEDQMATVIDIRKAKGRPPTTGPNLVLITSAGKLTIPRDRHIRVVRKP